MCLYLACHICLRPFSPESEPKRKQTLSWRHRPVAAPALAGGCGADGGGLVAGAGLPAEGTAPVAPDVPGAGVVAGTGACEEAGVGAAEGASAGAGLPADAEEVFSAAGCATTISLSKFSSSASSAATTAQAPRCKACWA